MLKSQIKINNLKFRVKGNSKLNMNSLAAGIGSDLLENLINHQTFNRLSKNASIKNIDLKLNMNNHADILTQRRNISSAIGYEINKKIK